MKGLYYLAHPYSGNHLENFKSANEIAAKLIQKGIHVYSPISHTHPIAVDGQMDLDDYTIWLPLDEKFMEFCDGIILCEGWEYSYGCLYEEEWFARHRKTIIFPDDLKELIK